MPEKLNDRTIFSLLEVNRSIQHVLEQRYTSVFWVRAEMNKLNYYPQSGHCYPDLVEKAGGKVVAQLRANLWKDDYQRVNRNFLSLLNEPLKDGIKILFSAKISFDPVHGLALRIIDMDPAYSLGELEKEKLETIQQLKNEGIFNRNKEHILPMLTQRIAVISVQTSKGYQDFTGKISANSWGYKYFHMLFPAILQGDKIVGSITKQLKIIAGIKSHFDVVAIIRGGGGDVGLSFYNDYTLAREVALFPLPVLTGIGHITNETVIEMVSFKNLITPTDLAGFLLQNFHNFAVPLLKATDILRSKPLRIIHDEKEAGAALIKRIKISAMSSVTSSKNIIMQCGLNLKKDAVYQLAQAHFLTREKSRNLHKNSQVLLNANQLNIGQVTQNLNRTSIRLMEQKTIELGNLTKQLAIMSPQNVLKRGYTITLFNGKALKNTNEVKPGETIETILSDGIITGKVIHTKKTVNNE